MLPAQPSYHFPEKGRKIRCDAQADEQAGIEDRHGRRAHEQVDQEMQPDHRDEHIHQDTHYAEADDVEHIPGEGVHLVMPVEEGLDEHIDQDDGQGGSGSGAGNAEGADKNVIGDYRERCRKNFEVQVVPEVGREIDQHAVVAVGGNGQLADAQEDGYVFARFELRPQDGDNIVQVDGYAYKDEHAGGKSVEGGAAV